MNAAHNTHPGNAGRKAGFRPSTFVFRLFAFAVLLFPALSRWLLPQLPAGADTAVHFFRAVQLHWLIRHGVVYSRWLPDLVFGYGYPLFNYYGPLANYVIVVFHAVGLPFVAATLAAFALADILGAVGAYLLARDTLGGPLPGLVAALAYAYSPYLLASLYRGALPESFGLALLPWLLWSLYRLYHRPRATRAAFTAALFALLPLTHNPSAALAAVAALAFIAGLALGARPAVAAVRASAPAFVAGGRAAFIICLLSLGAGLLLSACFWLPLILELGYIDISKAYAPAVINFRHNFLSFAQVFALPQPVDPQMIGTRVAHGLGLPQGLLALAGLFTLRRQPREQKRLLLLAALAVPVLVALTLPLSVPAWEWLPGLSLIQFPARLLGPASLLLALLAGSTFTSAGVGGLRAPAAVASVAGIMLFGFGWLYTGLDRSIPPQPVLADIHAYEHRTGVVGTTTAAEYLPRWVEQRPPDLSLDYTAPPIARLDRASLPAGARVNIEKPAPLSQSLEVESPTGFVAVFNLFYFPGWVARVDGELVSVAPTPVSGLASFPVPAGRHTLELQFTDTPPRTLGSLLSLAALIGLAVFTLRGRALWIAGPTPADSASVDHTPASRPHDGALQNAMIGFVVVGLAATGFKLAIADRPGSAFLRNGLESIQYPLDVAFGDQLQLIGYDDDGTLYWRAARPLSDDWSVSATLDWQGHRVAQSDAQHPGGLPTSRWFPEQFARDVHNLTPEAGAPPGAYDLRVTVYRQSDGVVLPPAGIKIGELWVARPAQPAELPANLPTASFGPVDLIGVTPPNARGGAGDVAPLRLHWQANASPDKDMQVEMVFAAENGLSIYERSITPTRPDFGTSQWQPGDQWLGFVEVKIPPDLPSGNYLVGLKSPPGVITIQRIQVSAPERVYTAPQPARVLNVPFGEVATLRGWDYTERTITLYWQPMQTTEVSYTVFVHVLDAAGHLVSQHDSPPANGRRPTTSWLPGEYVTDEHGLALPPEAAEIRVGLYDPKTGQRLPTPGGEFAIIHP